MSRACSITRRGRRPMMTSSVFIRRLDRPRRAPSVVVATLVVVLAAIVVGRLRAIKCGSASVQHPSVVVASRYAVGPEATLIGWRLSLIDQSQKDPRKGGYSRG